MSGMNTEVVSRFAKVTKCHGFKRRGLLAWLDRGAHLTLIQLVRSSWGSGIYVYCGIFPCEMVTGSMPPPLSYWLFMNAAGVMSEKQDTFIRLATRPEDELDANAVEEAFAWLLDWIEKNLADPEPIRQALLARDNSSLVGQLAHSRLHEMPDDWVWFLWARGELKGPPESYYVLPYYKKHRKNDS